MVWVVKQLAILRQKLKERKEVASSRKRGERKLKKSREKVKKIFILFSVQLRLFFLLSTWHGVLVLYIKCAYWISLKADWKNCEVLKKKKKERKTDVA
jgi:ABC-type Fe3+ transport system permease subunit